MKRVWFAWKLILAIAVILVIVETSRVIALTNRHTVIPNKVYRCAQPNGEHLRELVKAHGIRTVINLRGVSPELPTYQEECRACMDLGINQEDITFSAQALPSTSELKQLIEVLDRTEYPIVIHCKRGADRTGLVSTVTLLLYTDATPNEARRQLWPRFGHFRFGRTAAIDEFFDQYDAWLTKENKSHSRETFRDWMLNDYCPGPARSHLEFVNYKPEQKVDQAFTVTLKATNKSPVPWEFKPGNFAGIHVSYLVYDDTGKKYVDTRAGFWQETVQPGNSIDVVLSMPGLPAGKYTVTAELHDARKAGIPFRTNSFVKYGDDTAVTRIVVQP